MPELSRTSAKNGRVQWNGEWVGDVTDIQLNDTVGIDEGATSSTGGKVDRTVGHEDASGSFVMQQEPTFSKGDKANLRLQYNSGKDAYNDYAVITGIDESIPVAEGTRITWTVNFGQAVESSTSSSVE